MYIYINNSGCVLESQHAVVIYESYIYTHNFYIDRGLYPNKPCSYSDVGL